MRLDLMAAGFVFVVVVFLGAVAATVIIDALIGFD